MKNTFFSLRFFLTTAPFVLLAALASCGAYPTSYAVVFPSVPESWKAALGEASWHVEWFDGEGSLNYAEVSPGASLSIDALCDAASPVCAYPYYPAKGVKKGDLKCAGAIAPWDISGNRVILSWIGGVDAVFWSEIANVDSSGRSAHKFDWKSWRVLALDLSLQQDLWLCDWAAIGKKTASSGFNKRRIAPRALAYRDLQGYHGTWYGTSPFDAGISAGEGGGGVLKAPIVAESNILFNERGILRYSEKGAIFLPWD